MDDYCFAVEVCDATMMRRDGMMGTLIKSEVKVKSQKSKEEQLMIDT
jgi:hypothetical protein